MLFLLSSGIKWDNKVKIYIIWKYKAGILSRESEFSSRFIFSCKNVQSTFYKVHSGSVALYLNGEGAGVQI